MALLKVWRLSHFQKCCDGNLLFEVIEATV
jgi:hypothetical protein